MTWSQALYYPWIQVRDHAWLKNAVLYWDVVSTIVPADLVNPYTDDDERALVDEGWLRPLWVNQERAVFRASDGTLRFLEHTGTRVPVHKGGTSHGAEVAGVGTLFEEIAHGKVSIDLRAELRRRGLYVEGSENGWPSINRTVFDLHMTHLAHYLATDRHLALVTDEPGLSPITDSLALGSPVPAAARSGEADVPMDSIAGAYNGYITWSGNLAAGTLTRYVFQTVGVSAETPVRDLIAFRKAHASEIGRFRAALDELTSKAGTDFPSREAFEQTMLDIFRNSVRPALDELERAKQARLPQLAPSLVGAGAVSAVPAWAAPVLNTPGKIIAAAAVAGVYLTAFAVKQRADRKTELSKDPYAFLLAARDRFGHGPEWRIPRRWLPGKRRRPY